MVKIKCDYCKEELEELGGLLFSPPSSITTLIVTKYHLCANCFMELDSLLRKKVDKHLLSEKEYRCVGVECLNQCEYTTLGPSFTGCSLKGKCIYKRPQEVSDGMDKRKR